MEIIMSTTSFSIHVSKAELKGQFDWQLMQTINVCNEEGKLIAKAEIECVTLNRHRDAIESYELLESGEEYDWLVPFNFYFKGQNVKNDVAQQLHITPNVKKAQTHIMIEALSVIPNCRNQGLASALLKAIIAEYPKAQSICLLSMPMALFVDVNDCEDEESREYYDALNLAEEEQTADDISAFFNHTGFIELTAHTAKLDTPLPYQLFMGSPESITTVLDK